MRVKSAAGRGESFLIAIHRQDGRAQRVADSQLELPVLGPRFGLFVLADLEQDRVAAGLELALADILIDAVTRVIDVIGGQQFAVQPDLVGVDTTQTQLAPDALASTSKNATA